MANEKSFSDRWWANVDWTGVVAVVLAVGISLSMILTLVGMIMSVTMYGRSLSEQASTLLATIFGAAIGALATYLGQAKCKQKEKEPEQ